MKTKLKKFFIDSVLLPLVGLAVFLLLWTWASSLTWDPEQKRADLPNPVETVRQSSKYLMHPFSHVKTRTENYDGLGLVTLNSLKLVGKGYLLSLLLAVPIGFALGASKTFTKCFDPIFQLLRPVSPLAWYPLAGVIMISVQRHYEKLDATEWQCIMTIAICAMWPTALNTAVGVRAVPQDYLNVAKVLRLGKFKTLTKVMLPSALPYMFTGFRLSLGLAWLVIVAAEMLSGKSGIGFFVNDSYSNADYGSMLMSILIIGFVGLVLDRMMTVVEKNVDFLLSVPGRIGRLVGSMLPKAAEGSAPHAAA